MKIGVCVTIKVMKMAKNVINARLSLAGSEELLLDLLACRLLVLLGGFVAFVSPLRESTLGIRS